MHNRLLIYGFIHVGLVGDWKSIFVETVSYLLCSGLYDCCEKIYISTGFLRNSDYAFINSFCCEHSRFAVICKPVHSPTFSELDTLRLLRNLSLQDDCAESYCFYVHTKGASITQERYDSSYKNHVDSFALMKQCSDLWRTYLLYFTVLNYKNCIRLLNDFDATGADLHGGIYIGNFWWSKYSYIRTLPDIDTMLSMLPPRNSDLSRFYAERWIGWNKSGNMHNLRTSPPLIKYIDQQNSKDNISNLYYSIPIPSELYGNSSMAASQYADLTTAIATKISELHRLLPFGPHEDITSHKKILLHVGCGNQTITSCTRNFDLDEWCEVRFDINPNVSPDIIGSMTDMSLVGDCSVDAIYSKHNIEHLYPHEVSIALLEFYRVLHPHGFVIITCPDLKSICALVADNKLSDPAYISAAGPISAYDMLYGFRPSLAKGNLYMAHHSGFTQQTLTDSLLSAGFSSVKTIARNRYFDLWSVATKMPFDDKSLDDLIASYLP